MLAPSALLLLLLLLSAVHALPLSPSRSIVPLTEKTFRTVVGGGSPVVVKFYSTHCPHCAEIASPFQQAAARYSSRKVLFAELDGDTAKGLIRELGIPHYPYIVYYEAHSKKGVHFNGRRTAASILTFVEGRQASKARGAAQADEEEPVERTPRHSCPVDDGSEPPKGAYGPVPSSTGLIELSNTAQFNQLIASNRPVFVKFYYPTCKACGKLAPIWESFAKTIVAEKIDLAVASFNGRLDESLLDRYGVKFLPTLTLFTSPSKWAEYTGPHNVALMVAHVRQQLLQPAVPDPNSANPTDGSAITVPKDLAV